MNNPPNAPKVLLIYRRLLLSLVGFAFVTSAFYIVIYTQTQVWQLAVAAGLVLVAPLIAPVIYRLVKQGKYQQAGWLTLIGAALGYGVNQLTWAGLTPYHIVGGVLMMILVAQLTLPRRYRIWAAAIILYLAYLALIDRFPPFPRQDTIQLPVLTPYAIGTNILLVLVLFYQSIQLVQNRSIRARMLTTYILLALLPTAVVGTTSSVLSIQNARDLVYGQLSSIADLKKAEIDAWVDNLYSTLYLAAPRQLDMTDVQNYLNSPTVGGSEIYTGTLGTLLNNFQNVTLRANLFEKIFLMDSTGRIVLSSDVNLIGQNRFGRPYFLDVAYFQEFKKEPYITPPYIDSDLRRKMVTAVVPILEQNGNTVALLAGYADLTRLNNIMAQGMQADTDWESYLVRADHVRLTRSRYAEINLEVTDGYSLAIDQAITQQSDGQGSYDNFAGVSVLGAYRWLPDLQVALIAEQERGGALSSGMRALFTSIGVTLIAVFLAIGVGLVAANRITTPLADLAATAERIARGDTQLVASLDQGDEIGALARSFNSMTAQLRHHVDSLEQRVADRTRDLEAQSLQLQVAAEIAREAASVRDLDDLLNRTVTLIRERFGFYHAGIFLLDEAGEYAVLRAATGEAGQKMLASGHRLKVGETGIVGYVTHLGLARIALDVGADAVYFRNPLLPQTSAEAALPLMIGTRIIGALDVQSTQGDAFTDNNLKIFQTLADQLAIAIENARLFKGMEQTLRDLETVQRRFTRETWQALYQRAETGLDYRYQGVEVEAGVKPNPEAAAALQRDRTVITVLPVEEPRAASALAVPLKLRGQTIGVLNLRFDGQRVPIESVTLFEEVADRLVLLLENARLLRDAQRLALQEQQINVISTEIRKSSSVNAILQSAVRELGRALGASHTFIQLGVPAEASLPTEPKVTHV